MRLYFNNNKSLIVYVDYALSGFDLCQSRRHKNLNSV